VWLKPERDHMCLEELGKLEKLPNLKTTDTIPIFSVEMVGNLRASG
jgi:hypothetical protein